MNENRIAEPTIRFQPWRKWIDRGRSPLDPACGGVYLFAHFPSGPPREPPTPDNLPAQVVYVGDAKDLNKRPLSGEHHRLERYKRIFGRNTSSLYVSLAPLYESSCKDYLAQRMFAFHAEAMLAWNYTKRHGHPPVLVYKEGKAPKELAA